MNGKQYRWNLNVGMHTRTKLDYTLLATTVVHFQEELYVHIVGSLIGDVDGAETGRSSGCASKKAKDASSCQADNIFEESIFEAFRVAWNGVVANKNKLTEKWDEQIESGTPLERLRAKQMKMMIEDGPIQTVIPEHVILVLERIIAYDKTHFEVRFLDGTMKRIAISE